MGLPFGGKEQVTTASASRDVHFKRSHAYPHVATNRLANKHWRLLGARSQGEVHGFYVAQLRRRMGVTAVREFARHRLSLIHI